MANINLTSAPDRRHFTLQKSSILSRAVRINRWKDWRIHKGIKTQKGLALATGFSPSWISRVERGEIIPNVLQFCILAQTLGLGGGSLYAIYEDLWNEIEKLRNQKYEQNISNNFTGC